jgi:hypothetical protein
LRVEKSIILFAIIIWIVSSIFCFIYLDNIKLNDYSYFYPPTTLHRIENIKALCILYGLTAVVYSFLLKEVFGERKKVLIFCCIVAIVTSPLQLWVLFSSSTRDYLRAPVLAVVMILISFVVKQKIIYTNKNIFICSAVMISAMSFRQEIILYVPIFAFAIIVFNDKSIRESATVVSKIGLICLPGYVSLTSGFANSVSRAAGRFIPGLSEDVIRTYAGEPNNYIGPFNDQTAHQVTIYSNIQELNIFQISVSQFHELTSFIIEYLTRLLVILVNTYLLPLTSNMYPPFFESTLVGGLATSARLLFSENYIYIISVLMLFFRLYNNKKLLLFLIICGIYISLINGLQFFSKNIFHLEIISYIVLIFGAYLFGIHAIKFVSKKI